MIAVLAAPRDAPGQTTKNSADGQPRMVVASVVAAMKGGLPPSPSGKAGYRVMLLVKNEGPREFLFDRIVAKFGAASHHDSALVLVVYAEEQSGGMTARVTGYVRSTRPDDVREYVTQQVTLAERIPVGDHTEITLKAERADSRLFVRGFDKTYLLVGFET